MRAVNEINVHSDLHGDRVFHRVGSENYWTKSGMRTRLRWQSACVVCGEAFEVTTSQFIRRSEDSTVFSQKTCAAHRVGKETAMALRGASPDRQKEIWASIKASKTATRVVATS
jgi:hypothetical protein